MNAVPDFEDLLQLLHHCHVRYLIIIDRPKHQEDARVLREVKRLRDRR